MDQTLRKIYYDLDSPAAYSSINRVYKEAQKFNISRDKVQEFMEKQRVYTMYKPVNRKFKRMQTKPSGLNTDWQGDLAVFSQFSKFNKKFVYLLVLVDVLSKKIHVEPAKTKTAKDMILAFKAIFERAQTKPWKIFTDNGWEFNSKEMKSFWMEQEILHFSAKTHKVLHATMAERAIRTIKDRLYKRFGKKGSLIWLDDIQKIVDGINNSVCSVIGMRPNDVTYGNAEALRTRVFETDVKSKPTFKVGDHVRIEMKKVLFTKGSIAKYTDEIFVVAQVLGHTNPVVYKIKTQDERVLDGYYYAQELSKASTDTTYRIQKVLGSKEENNKVFYKVQYAGKDVIEWICEDEIIYKE